MLTIGKDPETWLVHRVLEQRAAERPDHPVMHWSGLDYSYAAINREANRIAAGLPEATLAAFRNPGATLTEEALLRHCAAEVPYSMVPRYMEFRADLPRTPTQKVRKVVLREAGITPATWDREAAGFKVTRDGLARRL